MVSSRDWSPLLPLPRPDSRSFFVFRSRGIWEQREKERIRDRPMAVVARVVLIAPSSASISRNYGLDCFSSAYTPGPATAPVATTETAARQQRAHQVRCSPTSNNYTAPLERFKAASPYIFSTRRPRGSAGVRHHGVSTDARFALPEKELSKIYR